MSVLRRAFDGPWITFFALWAALAMASAAWAVATPLGASPDEPAHIIKAASVARGQFIGDPTNEPAVTAVQVPVGIATAGSWPCYAFQPDVEASCMAAIPDGNGLTTAKTSAGLYNPAYYAFVGWPSLISDDTSKAVVLMRIANAILVSFFFAIALVALTRTHRSVVMGIAFLAAATPMSLFLAGAVNPNALEISAGTALTASLLLIVRRWESLTLWPWLAAVATSGVLLAQARGLSPLWMLVIAVAVLVASPPKTLLALVKRIDVLVTIVLLGLGVAAAGLWLTTTGTLRSMGVFPGASEVTPATAFVTVLVDRVVDPGLVGVFGWLDTPAPPVVYAWWAFLGVGLSLMALVVARGRALAAYLVGLAGFFLVPATAQALSVQSSGYIWQGRYALIGYAVAVILAAFAISSGSAGGSFVGRRDRIRLILVVGVVTVGAHVFAFVSAIKRYAVGLDRSWIDFVYGAEWLPPFGALPWALLLVAGLSGVVAYLYHSAGPESTSDALSELAPSVQKR